MDKKAKSPWISIGIMFVGVASMIGGKAAVAIAILVLGFSGVKIIMNHMGLNVTLNSWDIVVKNKIGLTQKSPITEYKSEESQSKETGIFIEKINSEHEDPRKKTTPITLLKEFFGFFKGIFSSKDDRFKR